MNGSVFSAVTRDGGVCRQPGDAGQPAEQGQPLIPAEEVVSRSGLGAQVITSFLFEHYVHMIAPEAIEDAAAAAEKFSDAMFMLGRGSNDTGTFGTSLCLACAAFFAWARWCGCVCGCWLCLGCCSQCAQAGASVVLLLQVRSGLIRNMQPHVLRMLLLVLWPVEGTCGPTSTRQRGGGMLSAARRMAPWDVRSCRTMPSLPSERLWEG